MTVNQPTSSREPKPSRRYAYVNGDGSAVFFTVAHDDTDPPVCEGLTPVLLTTDPGPAPSPHHKLHAATGVWSDPRTAKQKSDDAWTSVRQRRDALLRNTDFTQLGDSPKNKQAWAAYRQALRDITQQADPFNLTWPTPPSN